MIIGDGTHVDILLEAELRVRAEPVPKSENEWSKDRDCNIRRQDRSLGATLGDILVLERLCRCQAVVLVKQLTLVDGVRSESHHVSRSD